MLKSAVGTTRLGLVVAACGTLVSSVAAQTLYGPLPYFSGGDSPFSDKAFGYFHLETFESHRLEVPGVTAIRGGVTTALYGPWVHCTLDGPAWVPEGTAGQGDTYSSGAGEPADLRFTFSAAELGSLPTHAGLAWKNDGVPVTFEAFDAKGVSLGKVVGGRPDGSAVEHRFFGAANPGGISAIRLSRASGELVIDHLQFGGGDSAADLNNDGFLDFSDFAAFVACYERNDCPTGTVTVDSVADFFDGRPHLPALVDGC